MADGMRGVVIRGVVIVGGAEDLKVAKSPNTSDSTVVVGAA